jgi:hypothetical protein
MDHLIKDTEVSAAIGLLPEMVPGLQQRDGRETLPALSPLSRYEHKRILCNPLLCRGEG